MLLTGGLMLYGNIQGRFLTFIVKKTFIITGIMLVGMVILDMTGGPNWIASGLGAMFNTLKAKIVEFFSNPGKYILQFLRNVLAAAKVVFSKTKDFLISWGNRIKTSFINFWQKITAIFNLLKSFLTGELSFNDFMRTLGSFIKGDVTDWAEKKYYYLLRFILLLEWVFHIGGCTGIVSKEEYPYVQSNADMLLHLNYRAHNRENYKFGGENLFMFYLKAIANEIAQGEGVAIGNEAAQVKYIAETLRKAGFSVVISESVGDNVSTVYVPNTKKLGVTNPNDVRNPDSLNQSADIVIYRVIGFEDEISYEMFFGMSDNFVIPGINLGTGLKESTFMTIMEMFLARFSITALWQDVRDAIFDPNNFFRGLAISQIPGDILMVLSDINEPSHQAQDLLSKKIKNTKDWEFCKKEAVGKNIDFDNPSSWSQSDRTLLEYIEQLSPQNALNRLEIGNTFKFGTRQLFEFGTKIVGAFLQWGVFWPQTIYTTILGTVMGLKEQIMWSAMSLLLKAKGLSSQRIVLISQKAQGSSSYKFLQAFAHNYWFHSMMEWMYDLGPAADILNNLAYYGGADALEDLNHYEPPVTQSLVQNLLLTTNGRNPTLDEFRFNEDIENRISQELELKAKTEMLLSKPQFQNLLTELDVEKFLEEVKSGIITNLSDEDAKTLRNYFEITSDDITPTEAVNKFAMNLVKVLDGEKNTDKLTRLMKLETINGETSLKIQMGSEEVVLNVNPEKIQDSAFYQTLLLLNAEEYMDKILARAIIGATLNVDGTVKDNVKGPGWGELIALTDKIKDTEIHQLLEEFIKMQDEEEFFADGSGRGSGYQLIFKDAMIDFRTLVLTQIRDYLVGHHNLAESQQLSLHLIESIFIMNCPQAKENYKKRMTWQIHNLIKQGQRKTIVGMANPFLILDIDPATGVVTDVKFSATEDAEIKANNILNKIFLPFSEVKISPTGADGISRAPIYVFYVNEVNGEKVYKCIKHNDGIITHEYKMRLASHSIIDVKTSNIVTENKMTEEAIKIFRELGLLKDGEVATYDIPLGGTAGIRRTIETFQKAFGIYPDDPKGFTVNELKRKIDAKTALIRTNNGGKGSNLGILLKKWVLKQSIIALFQKEPAVQVDENGFIVYKHDDGTEVVHSISSEQDSLKSHKTGIDQMKHTADIEIFEGIKILKADGTTEYKKTISFKDTDTQIDVTDAIRLSAYTGAYSPTKTQSDNIIDLHYPNNKEIWLSSAIFHTQFKDSGGVSYDRYYIIKKDGSILMANTFTGLKDKIKNEYANEADLKTNPPIISIINVKSNENFKNTNEKEIIATIAVDLENKLLNGEIIESQGIDIHNSELEIFNTKLITHDDYCAPVASLLVIMASRERYEHFIPLRDIANSQIETISNKIGSMDSEDEKYKLLMSAIERTILAPSIELDSCRITDEEKYRESYMPDRKSLNSMVSTTNVRVAGSAIHSITKLFKNMGLYYANLRQRILRYVLPVGNTEQESKKEGFFVQVSERDSPQGDYIYDLENIITTIDRLNYRGSINQAEDITIDDLRNYQSGSLADQSKIEAINNLILQNLDIGKDVLKADGTIQNLTPNQSPTKFLALRYGIDRHGNKIIYFSLPALGKALRTLIGTLNTAQRVNIQAIWTKNLQDKYGLGLDDLKHPDGGKKLLQSNPDLKDALIEGYRNIDKITYTRAEQLVNKIQSVGDLLKTLENILSNNIFSSLQIITIVKAKDDITAKRNDVISIIMKFALDIFEIMTDYGQIKPVDYTRYMHERFIFTLPSPNANYRKIWNKLHTAWMVETKDKKANNQEVDVITEKFIEEYLTKMNIVEGSIEEIVLRVIQDIIENKKAMPVPFTNKIDENGNPIPIKEEEQIFRGLYDIVSSQVEIDRLYTLSYLDYVKLFSKYALIGAYKTIMEIGGIDSRLELRQNVKNFINDLIKEVRKGYYNTDLDFARLFAASINLRKILRKTNLNNILNNNLVR
ncbi:hypothetical protein ES705_16209 [subsurface metagenome]